MRALSAPLKGICRALIPSFPSKNQLDIHLLAFPSSCPETAHGLNTSAHSATARVCKVRWPGRPAQMGNPRFFSGFEAFGAFGLRRQKNLGLPGTILICQNG